MSINFGASDDDDEEMVAAPLPGGYVKFEPMIKYTGGAYQAFCVSTEKSGNYKAVSSTRGHTIKNILDKYNTLGPGETSYAEGTFPSLTQCNKKGNIQINPQSELKYADADEQGNKITVYDQPDITLRSRQKTPEGTVPGGLDVGNWISTKLVTDKYRGFKPQDTAELIYGGSAGGILPPHPPGGSAPAPPAGPSSPGGAGAEPPAEPP